jgi:hypothetical protein
MPGTGSASRGFPKERRLEPQITIGLLTDASSFPLMISAFEGNKAETTTVLPVIEAFMEAHRIPDVTVVADAGMVSAGNQQAIEDAGLSFILGARIPEVPYVVAQWRREHPGQEIPDGHIFTQPWPASLAAGAGTRSSTTSTRPTGPGGPCATSTSRSPRPRKPSPAPRRSSGIGSWPSQAGRREDVNMQAATPGRWKLAASVHKADIDHGGWSSRPGAPHAYPPNLHASALVRRTELGILGVPGSSQRAKCPFAVIRPARQRQAVYAPGTRYF